MSARSFLLSFALLGAPAFAHDACLSAGYKATADDLLREMSKKLAGAHSFSFTAQREIDPALLEGTRAAEKARIEARVLRPDKLAAQASTNLGRRHSYADGRTLTVVDVKAHTYATVPMRTDIDGVVATLDEKYGFTPPLAEFAVSNPYAEFHRQAQSVRRRGVEKIGGSIFGLGAVQCHHLVLKGKVADAELWIGVADFLPRQLVATFHRPGHPQLRVAFSSWNLSAPANAAGFTFTPPAGAEKIEMYTPAQMSVANKRVGARQH